MRPVNEQLELFESIFNNDDVCPLVLSALTSPDELEGNKKNQESSLSISKMILENLDNMHFVSEQKKAFVKKYFERVPDIVKQYEQE